MLHAAYGACLATNNPTFHDRYVAIALLFCARPIADAGADGAISDDASPADASADGNETSRSERVFTRFERRAFRDRLRYAGRDVFGRREIRNRP